MIDLTNAVVDNGDGVTVGFVVSASSKGTQVPSGYNSWRKAIEAKLSEPPEKGRANQQLIEHLAELLDVNISDINILSGSKSGRKTVRIIGISKKRVIDVFHAVFEG